MPGGAGVEGSWRWSMRVLIMEGPYRAEAGFSSTDFPIQYRSAGLLSCTLSGPRIRPSGPSFLGRLRCGSVGGGDGVRSISEDISWSTLSLSKV